MKQILFFLSLILFSLSAFPQSNKLKIEFPDIPGYKTLKCEFHQHTVFSDGSVWPEIRVAEAVRYGLDAISITDHLEYQPKEGEVPHENRNIGYELASKTAKGHNVLVINGAEITRSMPPGHLNAIFIKDANKLLDSDPAEVMREANKQGGFVFWNHPHWTSQKKDGVAELTKMHKELLKEGLIHGIEIVNGGTYSDEAFQVALDNNLAILGNTDVHGIVEWGDYVIRHHRPTTFVFAREKTEEALKEAMVDRRTAVWFNNTLFGKAEFLAPLVEESIVIRKAEYRGSSSVLLLTVENISDASYILENNSDYRLHTQAKVFTVRAHTTEQIQIRTLKKLDEVKMKFKVLNAFVSPDDQVEVEMIVGIE